MNRRRTLLIGWDAADWKVISPLLAAGVMPHLQRLIERGVMGNLAGPYPLLSPMLWTSIATGKRAYKHGILGYFEPDPASCGSRPITNRGRKAKAVWNMLNRQGLCSNVIGWPASHPAEPINGIMVSDRFKDPTCGLEPPRPLHPGQVHPAGLQDAGREFRVHPDELDRVTLQSFVPRAAEIHRSRDPRLNSVAAILADCAGVQAAATYAMQLDDWDFTAVYFNAINRFCRGFMRYQAPRLPWVSEEEFALYKNVVNTGYRFHDMMLGVLVELAGPDANIILCSDHGLNADRLRVRESAGEPLDPADGCRPYGIFAASGPAFRRGELVLGASLLDITPTILSLYGLPVGEDMDGRPLLQALVNNETPPPIPGWDRESGDDGCHPGHLRVDLMNIRESSEQPGGPGSIDEPGVDREKGAAAAVKEQRYNLARDLADSGRSDQAMAMFAQLWAENPDESRFGRHLFSSQLDRKDTRAARETLTLMESRKREYAKQAVEELKQRAAQTAAVDAWPDAREQRQLSRLRRKAGTDQAAFAWLRGRLLAAEGRPEEALAAFRQAEEAQPRNRPSLFIAQGDALIAACRPSEAEQRYREALHIDPVNAGASLGLAQALLRQRGRADAALEALAASLGLCHHNPSGHYLRGIALQSLRRPAEARRAFETALSQNPVFPAAHRCLARLLLQSGDMLEARRHLILAADAAKRIRLLADGDPAPGFHKAAEIEVVRCGSPGAPANTDASPTESLNPQYRRSVA